MKRKINNVERFLISIPEHQFQNENENERILIAIKRGKRIAIRINDQKTATQMWCFEKIIEIHKNYLLAFSLLKKEKYYEAWCSLEHVDININSLLNHFPVDEDHYRVLFLERIVAQFQSIFPYKLFFSPAYIQLEKKCTICGNIISPFSHCEHAKGNIYNGEMCLHEITKAEILELSIVTNPVQKYSVLFFQGENGEKGDPYNYSAINYLANHLEAPYDDWRVQISYKLHPHSQFTHILKDEMCPCGSDKKYDECCLKEPGVKMLHYEFQYFKT